MLSSIRSSFSPDSILGVPGLMRAYHAGNVTLANAVGTGIADDKAIYTYVPEIIEFYLGEKAILKNVPTWRCREPEALRYVLAHLGDLVVKEVNGSGGYGMFVGPRATKAQIEAFAVKLRDGSGQFHRPADARAFDDARHSSIPASRRAMSICVPSSSPERMACASCRAASPGSR